ncbi:MDR family MFS transporter [Saccharomonospora sp. NPDC046836]|uniref:MDR family MFS transporter n=1 Tax=Saccharomonospora sp. NPDC046836 TaxID=3156921 RepID=UPI0033DA226F
MTERSASATLSPGADPDRLDRHIWTLAGVVMLGAVMTMLDATAVNVAFDAIRRDMNASLYATQWVITAYLLTMAVVVPITGWAIDRFGTKRLWMFAVSTFVFGSALCGLSWSVGSLIGFRILQGAGGGMIVPLAQTILAEAAGPRRLGRAMSLLGVITILGPVLGPVIGGVLVQAASWHWIFYINLPVGLAALAAGAKLLPDRETRPAASLDLLGFLLASLGIAGLTFGLSQASADSGVTNEAAYLPAIAGIVLLGAFVYHSLRRGSAALIDVRLFTNREFAVASVILFLISAVLYGALLLLPLYYQMVRGTGAFDAGLLLVPQGLGVAMSMLIAGRLTDRLGARVVVVPGLLLAAVGTFVFTQATNDSPLALLAAALFVRGLGIGFIMTPTTAASYLSLPADTLGRAAGATMILRQLGSSFGSAVFAMILAQNLVRTSTIPAFAGAFWAVVVLTLLVAVPAMLLPRLSRRRPATDTSPREKQSS